MTSTIEDGFRNFLKAAGGDVDPKMVGLLRTVWFSGAAHGILAVGRAYAKAIPDMEELNAEVVRYFHVAVQTPENG